VRKQRGQLIETKQAWFIRYYTTGIENGQEIRKQTCVGQCEESDLYRHESDVRPLMEQHINAVNAKQEPVTGSMLLGEYVTRIYLPWVELNKPLPCTTAISNCGIDISRPDSATPRAEDSNQQKAACNNDFNDQCALRSSHLSEHYIVVGGDHDQHGWLKGKPIAAAEPATPKDSIKPIKYSICCSHCVHLAPLKAMIKPSGCSCSFL
jgi:hypothetical protein